MAKSFDVQKRPAVLAAPAGAISFAMLLGNFNSFRIAEAASDEP
jgi:hypothetical protein